MLGLLQQVAPYVRGKECVWVLAGAFGLPAGYIVVGASQILSTEIDSKNLPIAYGLMNTATAMGCFIRPLLIGLFRDNYGSYSGMFRFIGGMLAISFLFSLGLWITDRPKHRKAGNASTVASVSIPEPTTISKEGHTYI
uniref:Monocarboxylate transporter n=1 Tax=Rhipicephalus zambeziensis TaxID=60191 RepID=A0A224YTZ1_9ACAR